MDSFARCCPVSPPTAHLACRPANPPIRQHLCAVELAGNASYLPRWHSPVRQSSSRIIYQQLLTLHPLLTEADKAAKARKKAETAAKQSGPPRKVQTAARKVNAATAGTVRGMDLIVFVQIHSNFATDHLPTTSCTTTTTVEEDNSPSRDEQRNGGSPTVHNSTPRSSSDGALKVDNVSRIISSTPFESDNRWLSLSTTIPVVAAP